MPENAVERFRSHRHFIEAFGRLAGKDPFTSNEKALATFAATIPPTSVINDRSPPSIDYDEVHRRLRNAWSTELLQAAPSEWAKEDDEFIRVANSWGVVQAYYVGYHMTQALWVAKGNLRPKTHPKTQNLYAALWTDRPLELGPWTFGLDHNGWKNLPAGATADLATHPWENCTSANCWAMAGTALKGTRRTALTQALSDKRDLGSRERKREWQADEKARLAAGRTARTEPSSWPRPHLTGQQKAQVDANVGTTTFLHYLYRLRIGANYDDAAVYTDGPENDSDSYLLHRRMSFLSSGLALITEMRIANLVGAPLFYGWVDDFIQNNIPASYSLGLKERRPLL